jgi:hypothetical protein
MTIKTKQTNKRKAWLITEPVWNTYNKIPIWVLNITDDLFPVKFEYRQRGYKGIIFSERLNKIEFA